MKKKCEPSPGQIKAAKKYLEDLDIKKARELLENENALKDRAFEILIWMFQESKYKDVLQKLYDIKLGHSITGQLEEREKSKKY